MRNVAQEHLAQPQVPLMQVKRRLDVVPTGGEVWRETFGGQPTLGPIQCVGTLRLGAVAISAGIELGGRNGSAVSRCDAFIGCGCRLFGFSRNALCSLVCQANLL